MTQTVSLGQKVKDKITGLEGVAIARTEWLHGCVRILVQPQGLNEGKPFEPTTIDEPQLEVVEEEPVAEKAATPRHGNRPDTTRHADTRR